MNIIPENAEDFVKLMMERICSFFEFYRNMYRVYNKLNEDIIEKLNKTSSENIIYINETFNRMIYITGRYMSLSIEFEGYIYKDFFDMFRDVECNKYDFFDKTRARFWFHRVSVNEDDQVENFKTIENIILRNPELEFFNFYKIGDNIIKRIISKMKKTNFKLVVEKDFNRDLKLFLEGREIWLDDYSSLGPESKINIISQFFIEYIYPCFIEEMKYNMDVISNEIKTQIKHYKTQGDILMYEGSFYDVINGFVCRVNDNSKNWFNCEIVKIDPYVNSDISANPLKYLEGEIVNFWRITIKPKKLSKKFFVNDPVYINVYENVHGDIIIDGITYSLNDKQLKILKKEYIIKNKGVLEDVLDFIEKMFNKYYAFFCGDEYNKANGVFKDYFDQERIYNYILERVKENEA